MGKKKKTKDFVEVARMCREEGFSEDKVLELCTPLCEEFRDKNYDADQDAQIPQPDEEITEDKLKDRDIFFDVLTRPLDQTKVERGALIDNIIKKPWFKGKIDMILIRVANFRKNGPKYERILRESYFDGKNKTDSDIYVDMGIASSTFYDMRLIAIRLFGILMWKYVKRRQNEDMARGIIPFKEIPQNNEDLSKLTPLNEL